MVHVFSLTQISKAIFYNRREAKMDSLIEKNLESMSHIFTNIWPIMKPHRVSCMQPNYIHIHPKFISNKGRIFVLVFIQDVFANIV